MIRIHQGDWLEVLLGMEPESVHCVVTSPPYWGLRDYGVEGQIGLEGTPESYVSKLVEGFREIRRVLRSDGTCWVNLGDSYSGSWGNQGRKEERGTQRAINGPMIQNLEPYPVKQSGTGTITSSLGLKPKDLIGIPWRVAFALQADGWWLRQDIIWSKPNPMPESVTDRCTKAHEYIFLLTKSERYYYDAEAVKEASATAGEERGGGLKYSDRSSDNGIGGAHNLDKYGMTSSTRNKRSVWTIASRPFAGAHFATFPPKIPEICIKAGCPEGGTVLDPFHGAGTTGVVASRLGRSYIGVELNLGYHQMAEKRIREDAPLFNQVTAS